MSDAPERISLLPDDGWSWCEGSPPHEENRIEYVRADLHAALKAERDSYRKTANELAERVMMAEAEVARLREALEQVGYKTYE